MNRQRSTDIILQLLAENALKSSSPQVVASETIAGKLSMKLSDTQQLLRVLDEKGFITIDIDNQNSLITHQGIQQLNRICP